MLGEVAVAAAGPAAVLPALALGTDGVRHAGPQCLQGQLDAPQGVIGAVLGRKLDTDIHGLAS